MNKKTLYTTIGLIAAIVLVILIFIWRSFHDVAITLKKSDLTVKIYKTEKDRQVEQATISQTANIRLTNGSFVIIPQGEAYDSAPISFTVNGDSVSIEVDPAFSKARLDALLDEEIGAINNVLQAKYSAVLTKFNQTRGNLYREGQWYATTLARKVSSSEETDLYRLIMKKEGAEWKLVVAPSLSISIKDHPDIPQHIIRDINSVGKT